MTTTKKSLSTRPGGALARAALASLATASLLAGAIALGGCVKPRATPISNEQPAPSFSLPDENGATVSLASMLERGPAVVVFYRGHW